MEPTASPHPGGSSPSKFVDYLAKISVIVGAYLVFDGIVNLRFILSMKDRPEFALAEQLVPAGILSTTEPLIEIILHMIGIAASIAMLRRRNWGRILYMTILSLLTVTGIISGVRTTLIMSEYIHLEGLGSSLPLVIVASIVSVGITLAIVWKLTRADVRKEFS